jgi:hypothetical protein
MFQNNDAQFSYKLPTGFNCFFFLFQSHNDKHDKHSEMEEKIKKQSRKVEKIHEDLENRVFKHNEL